MAQSNTPNRFCASGWRSMPSRCSTAACAARQDQMVEMVLFVGPIDDLRQRRPIRLVLQIGGARLGAGDDEAVEPAVPQFGDIAIALAGIACEPRRRAELPAARIASSDQHFVRPPRRASSTNCRSVASSAASGMLLTRPISMQLRAMPRVRLRLRRPDVGRGRAASRLGARAYSAAMHAVRCAALLPRPAPDRGRR